MDKLKQEYQSLVDEVTSLRSNSPSGAETDELKVALQQAETRLEVLAAEKENWTKKREADKAKIAELDAFKQSAESKIRELEDRIATSPSSTDAPIGELFLNVYQNF